MDTHPKRVWRVGRGTALGHKQEVQRQQRALEKGWNNPWNINRSNTDRRCMRWCLMSSMLSNIGSSFVTLGLRFGAGMKFCPCLF
jgi:hypothetical protein